MRLCARCGKSLDGMRSNAVYCSKTCKNTAASARRDEREPDRYRERYAQSNTARKANAKAAYWQDPEAHRLYSKNYRHTSREIRAAQQQRRLAAMRSPSSRTVTPREWERLKNRQQNRCAYCHRPCPALEMDHVVPLSRGGRHAIGNLLGACSACNNSKRAMFLTEWRLTAEGR